MAVLSDEAGAFHMALPLAVYQIMVIGPAELLEQNDWISPEAQRVTLSESDADGEPGPALP